MTLPADFAATLVDEWLRAGVTDAVVAPGSRSSPLAIALVGEARMRTHFRLDERSAGFFAIGLSLSTDRPVVVVTTSGTASVELHPAVVEADLASVPLIVCTADRPPELREVAAPQTIDQQRLFGRSPRYFFDFGVPEEETRPQWRSFASRLVAEALSNPAGPGPVHANLPFREPFGAEAGSPPPGRDGGRPWHEVVAGPSVSSAALERLVELCRSASRGIVVCGRGAYDRDACLAFSRAFGFPVLADSLAFPRLDGPGSVAAWEPIVKSAAALGTLRPDLVVHFGAPPASRPLSTWQSGFADQALHVLVDPYRRFSDPARRAGVVISAPVAALARAASEGQPGPAAAGFLQAWMAAEEAAQGAIDEVLDAERAASEPATARDLSVALAAGSSLVVSSSMPIRDYDAFSRPRPGAARVFSNRGANGIDGVSSTALGVATGSGPGVPTVGLLGDLAFLHDLSALVSGEREIPVRPTYVVVDNGGGGIFSFLPYTKALDNEVFERAFATPQSVDIATLARGFGCLVTEVEARAELGAAFKAASSSEETGVVVVRTDRDRNLALHGEIDEAVEAAVSKVVASG